jgi:hypothetical protein
MAERSASPPTRSWCSRQRSLMNFMPEPYQEPNEGEMNSNKISQQCFAVIFLGKKVILQLLQSRNVVLRGKVCNF